MFYKRARMKYLVAREARRERIHSPSDVARLMQAEAQADRECVWCLHRNTRGRLIEKELVAMGKLNVASVDFRGLFRGAIINNADGIVVVHNHPSGEVDPSSADLALAERIGQAASMLGIEFIDFIIVGWHDGELRYWAKTSGEGRINT